jgi:hypothetical protein
LRWWHDNGPASGEGSLDGTATGAPALVQSFAAEAHFAAEALFAGLVVIYIVGGCPLGLVGGDWESGPGIGRFDKVDHVAARLAYPAQEPGASDARVVSCRSQALASAGEILAEVPRPAGRTTGRRAQRPQPRCDRPHRCGSDDQASDEGRGPEDEPGTPACQAGLERHPFSRTNKAARPAHCAQRLVEGVLSGEDREHAC